MLVRQCLCGSSGAEPRAYWRYDTRGCRKTMGLSHPFILGRYHPVSMLNSINAIKYLIYRIKLKTDKPSENEDHDSRLSCNPDRPRGSDDRLPIRDAPTTTSHPRAPSHPQPRNGLNIANIAPGQQTSPPARHNPQLRHGSSRLRETLTTALDPLLLPPFPPPPNPLEDAKPSRDQAEEGRGHGEKGEALAGDKWCSEEAQDPRLLPRAFGN